MLKRAYIKQRLINKNLCINTYRLNTSSMSSASENGKIDNITLATTINNEKEPKYDFHSNKANIPAIYISSEFGKLLNIDPILSNKELQSAKLQNPPSLSFENNELIGDNSRSQKLFRLIEHSSKFNLFSNTAHYGNALSIYTSVKNKYTRKLYGISESGNSKNPFEAVSESPNGIYNLNLRIKKELHLKLNRIGFMIFRDGNLNLAKFPKSEQIEAILKTFREPIEEPTSYFRHEYFISVGCYLGIMSANGYTKKGIQIKVLNNQIIYPLYSVFPPTQQKYIDMFDKYLKRILSKYTPKSRLPTLDIGCGTGILGFILKKNGLGGEKVYSIDNNSFAIKSTDLNSQILGMAGHFNPILFDTVRYYKYLKEHSNINTDSMLEYAKSCEILDQYEIAKMFGVIVCNPPWLSRKMPLYPSGFLQLESGIHDTSHYFLKSSLLLAHHHLSENGHMVIIYSDLGINLGLEKEGEIEDLFKAFGFQVDVKHEEPFPIITEGKGGKGSIVEDPDPLIGIKQKSKMILYDLIRV